LVGAVRIARLPLLPRDGEGEEKSMEEAPEREKYVSNRVKKCGVENGKD